MPFLLFLPPHTAPREFSSFLRSSETVSYFLVVVILVDYFQELVSQGVETQIVES